MPVEDAQVEREKPVYLLYISSSPGGAPRGISDEKPVYLLSIMPNSITDADLRDQLRRTEKELPLEEGRLGPMVRRV